MPDTLLLPISAPTPITLYIDFLAANTTSTVCISTGKCMSASKYSSSGIIHLGVVSTDVRLEIQEVGVGVRVVAVEAVPSMMLFRGQTAMSSTRSEAEYELEHFNGEEIVL